MLKNKKIILGISSSVALYKVPTLISKLRGNGTNVFVVMTKNAAKLISKQIFEVMSGNKVSIEMFGEEMRHIELAKNADLILICPATANIIGKLANGIADDLLTTLVLASKARILICPAMNDTMWSNKAVQENAKKLREFGCKFIGPEKGKLACGSFGRGCLADLDLIFDEVEMALWPKDLKNKRFLITAGPTIERIDPVRYISNFSSGKMGYSLAKMAALRGAEVSLVSGPVNLRIPLGVKKIGVESADEMYKEVTKLIKYCDVFISVAAVCDYRPERKSKIKNQKSKLGKRWCLDLVENVDILGEISKLKKRPIIIGFALETDNLIKNARRKLVAKNLDLIIANGVYNLGRNHKKVILIDKNGYREVLEEESEKVASDILDRLV